MDHFYNGFKNELVKLARLDPATKAWATGRALTSGVAGGLMAGLTIGMAQRGKPEREKRSVMPGALSAAALSAALGLGKGIFEKGIEKKVLRSLARR